MSDGSSESLLVTGAGGHLGRKVVEELLARGARRVIATSRDPGKLADLKDRGVEIREADFNRPETLARAFAGADRLLLVSTDALGEPGLRLAQHRAAIRAAVENNVRHLVYTSLPNAHPTQTSSVPDDHFWTEQALFQTGLEWTILRNNLYAEILMMSVGPAVKSGRIRSATGSAGRSYVTRDDCARTAAGALLKAEGRAIFDVTGPDVLTHEGLATVLSELSGRSVVYEAISPEDVRQDYLDRGMPPFVARLAADFDIDAAQGYHAIVTPTVERFAGRQPISARAFLLDHKDEIQRLANENR